MNSSYEAAQSAAAPVASPAPTPEPTSPAPSPMTTPEPAPAGEPSWQANDTTAPDSSAPAEVSSPMPETTPVSTPMSSGQPMGQTMEDTGAPIGMNGQPLQADPTPAPTAETAPVMETVSPSPAPTPVAPAQPTQPAATPEPVAPVGMAAAAPMAASQPAAMDMSGEQPKMGFSFGAFAFGWLWAVFNLGKKWWIGLALFLGQILLIIPFINIIVGLAYLVIHIILGIKGRKMSWENKQWSSAANFNKAQKIWNIVGIVFFVLTIVGSIAMGGAIIASLGSVADFGASLE